MNENNKIIKDLKKEYIILSEDMDTEENKNIKHIFSELKLKINFPSKPFVLRKGEKYTISNEIFILYDNNFKKLFEIIFEKETKINSVIQLDNNDLIFLKSYETEKENPSKETFYKILIYKLRDKNYSLIQEINEGISGFEQDFEYDDYTPSRQKKYVPYFNKDISNNRFFCISNYGIKLFSLNEKNEYSLVSTIKHKQYIELIHEIDVNEFIIFSWIGKGNKRLEIDKINLDFQTDEYMLSLSKNIGLWAVGLDYIIIQKKFLVILIDNNYTDIHFFILDMTKGKLLKRYQLIDGQFQLIYSPCIKKWNNDKDNEFLLFYRDNIILFEFIEEGFTLKVKGYTTSNPVSEFNEINNWEKINEKENKFYRINENNENSIRIY